MDPLDDRTLEIADPPLPRGPEALWAGDVLSARYEIRALLGKGGMGAVYEAHDRDLDLAIALKTLIPGLHPGKEGLRMLKREVLLARQVSHENVCRLHDLGRDRERGLLFATMELLRGETLAQRLARGGRFEPAPALPLVEQMANGLDAAHRAGVVHRDFKLANVMLVADREGRGERAVLTDFGIARPSWGVGARDTAGTVVAGTPVYMAPEQLGGGSIGPQADIYALGVVLFEMVTGHLPFEGDDTLQASLRKLREDPASPREWVHDLPEAWEKSILRCLARAPHDRFRTAGELAAALQGRRIGWNGGGGPRGNLTAGRDRFVGRDGELEEIAGLIGGGNRVVSLLGTPGSGKTRLALEYGRKTGADWPGGVWFCDLTEARSLDGLCSAVAGALDVGLGGADSAEKIGDDIAARGRCLVILDNFEQIVSLAPDTLGRWLDRAGEATFLVTSRERLSLADEAPLTIDALDEASAVELFLLRAGRHRPGFTADEETSDEVRLLVRRLEGLPLAIELAAARMRVMAPRQIAERLSERFKLLSGCNPGTRAARHAALRAAIDTSWELLEPWEQAAFAQCSVFEGAFTLEAAEEVLDLSAWEEASWAVDVVQALVDKSLLRVQPGAPGGPRFSMYASLQEYARERIREQGEGQERRLEERHGAWYALLGSEEAIVSLGLDGGTERGGAIGRELDNLIAACRRAVRRGDGGVAAATFAAAWVGLEMRGPFRTGVELGGEVLGMPELEPGQRLRCLRSLTWANYLAGRSDEARRCCEDALEIARRSGDRRSQGRVLDTLGSLHRGQGRMEEARRLYEEALAIYREGGHRNLSGRVLGNLGLVYYELGRMEEALDRFEQALAIDREVGDLRSEGIVLGNLASFHAAQGRMEAARVCHEGALTAARKVGDRRLEGNILDRLGSLHLRQGRREEAGRCYEEALVIARQVGDRRAEGVVLGNLAEFRRDEGRIEEARGCYEEALAIHRQIGNRRFEGIALHGLARLHELQDRPAEARGLYVEALGIARSVGDRRSEAILLGRLGALHRREGSLEEARTCFREGERLFREGTDTLELGLLLGNRGLLDLQTGDHDQARAALEEASSLAREVGAASDSELGSLLSQLEGRLGTTPPAQIDG